MDELDVENILTKLGVSADDLLTKLLKYKQKGTPSSSADENSSSSNELPTNSRSIETNHSESKTTLPLENVGDSNGLKSPNTTEISSCKSSTDNNNTQSKCTKQNCDEILSLNGIYEDDKFEDTKYSDKFEDTKYSSDSNATSKSTVSNGIDDKIINNKEPYKDVQTGNIQTEDVQTKHVQTGNIQTEEVQNNDVQIEDTESMIIIEDHNYLGKISNNGTKEEKIGENCKNYSFADPYDSKEIDKNIDCQPLAVNTNCCQSANLENQIDIMGSLPNNLNKQSDILDNQSDNLKNQSDSLDNQSDILNNQSDVLDNQSDILDNQSDILDNRSDILGNRSDILDNRSDILNDQCDILNDQSDILNNQSDILNNQPDIFSNQSDILNDHSDDSNNQPDKFIKNSSIPKSTDSFNDQNSSKVNQFIKDNSCDLTIDDQDKTNIPLKIVNLKPKTSENINMEFTIPELNISHNHALNNSNNLNVKDLNYQTKSEIVTNLTKIKLNKTRNQLHIKAKQIKNKYSFRHKYGKSLKNLYKNFKQNKTHFKTKHKTKTPKKPKPKKPIKTETVRNKIMEQLALLRKRKSTDFVNPIKFPPFEPKQILKEERKIFKPNRKFTDNFNFKSLRPEGIKPTKTTDVTKIKGWKNKKFLIDTSLKQTKPDTKPKTPPPTTSFEPEPSTSVEPEKPNMSSAFSSVNLDGFLKSPDLKISYEIPTLKTDIPPREILILPPPKNFVKKEKPKPKPKDPKIPKPRTVAEKRKLELDAVAEKLKKLKPECKNDKSELSLPNSKSEITEFQKKASDFKLNYIYFLDHKLKVRTRNGKNIFARTNSNLKILQKQKKEYMYVPYKRKRFDYKNFKPSIFNPIQHKQEGLEKIRYKPGPLCKKSLLQIQNQHIWETVVKPLPNIYLEVSPSIGQHIHPHICHLVTSTDGILSNFDIDFALSVVKSPRVADDEFQEKTFIKFPVSYVNNQKHLLLRYPVQKEIEPKPVETFVCNEVELSIEDTVKSVLNRVLDYIDIKELTQDIIKDDTDFEWDSNDKEVNQSVFHKEELDGVEVMTRKPNKRSKTCLELRRLNVKFIEVDIEDKNNGKPCNKPYCEMGCVCLSLNNMTHLDKHCGQIDCMFGCICNFGSKTRTPKVSLPPGTDLLSAGTLSRLQNEAKKDLAKVEKEFTQTVIQAKNQTIVVGSSRDRQRRVTKAPKKYEDFTDADPELLALQKRLPEAVILDNFYKACRVTVTRLPLQAVVPYCMDHYYYDCECYYNKNYVPLVRKELNSVRQPKINKTNEVVETKTPKEGESKTTCVSARTKGIPTAFYAQRNKLNKFHKYLGRKLNIKPDEIIQKSYAKDTDKVIIDREMVEGDSSNRIIDNSTNQNNKASDVSNLPSLPILRIKSQLDKTKRTTTSCEIIASKQVATDKKDADRYLLKITSTQEPSKEISFKELNEAEVPLPIQSLESQVQKIIGNTNNKTLRLMPWTVLLDSYRNNSLQIWLSKMQSVKKQRLLVTENNVKIIKDFINIRLLKNINVLEQEGILLWILCEKLPKTKVPSETLVILSHIKGNVWELSGCCEKIKQKETPTSEPPKKDNEVWYFKHKFPGTFLYDSDLKPRKVELPKFDDNLRWWVIYLNKNISHITFPINNFTMRFADMKHLGAMAWDSGETIVIYLNDLKKKHEEFGIYAPPRKLFVLYVGPYHLDESLDLEMKRKATSYSWKEGQWLTTKIEKKGMVIDLTSFDSDEENKMNQISEGTDKGSVNDGRDDIRLEDNSQGSEERNRSSEENSLEIREEGEKNRNSEIPNLIRLKPLSKLLPNGSDFGKKSMLVNGPDNKRKCLEENVKQNDGNGLKNSAIGRILIKDITGSAKWQGNHENDGERSDDHTQFKQIVSDKMFRSGPASHAKVALNINKKNYTTKSDPNQIEQVATESISSTQETVNEVVDITISDSESADESSAECRKVYLITNIPAIGYLELEKRHKRVNFVSKLTQKQYHFCNEGDAATWFKNKISKAILIIPLNFPVEAQILYFRPNKINRFDEKTLLGNHMVGSFGLINFMAITEPVLKSFQFTPEETMAVIERRARRLFLIRCMQCAHLFMSREEAQKLTDVTTIVELCTTEIAKLQKECSKYIGDLKQLNVQKTVLSEKKVKLLQELKLRQTSPNKKVKQVSLLSQGISKTFSNGLDIIPINSSKPQDRFISPPPKAKKPNSMRVMSTNANHEFIQINGKVVKLIKKP